MAHRVLLVDDEPNVLAGLERALCLETFEILTAQSAQDALSILDKTPIDVVIADQDMPGMKGTELLRIVHEQFPDTIRFILTGKPTLDVAISAINKGAITRFFTKPCNGTDLAYTVRHALQRRDLAIEAAELLKTVRQQSVILQNLEKAHPGITRVKRDEQGAFVIMDIPNDIDELIQECRNELNRAQK